MSISQQYEDNMLVQIKTFTPETVSASQCGDLVVVQLRPRDYPWRSPVYYQEYSLSACASLSLHGNERRFRQEITSTLRKR